MERAKKTVWTWSGAHLPPSVERIDPRGWLLASACAGAIAGAASLALMWRPLPGLPLPPGALADHFKHWAALAAHAASPRLFPRMSAAYADFWGRISEAERWGMLARCALAAWLAALPAWLLAGPMLRPRDMLIELRGAKRREGADAESALRDELRPRIARGADHEVAPGIAYPAELWTRGTLVVGGVGSGKSTFLRPLIDKVARSGEQMLLFDAKSEFTEGWAGPALLAPWDARSLAWDVAKDLRNVLEMQRFAEALVAESSDAVWSNASRQVLVGVLLSLRGQLGSRWGWADLRERLSLPHSALLSLMEAWHPVAARSLEKASVTSQGVLINLAAFCSSIFHLAEAWGGHPPSRRVSMVEWTLGKSPHRQLILQGHAGYGSFASSVAEAIVGVFSALVASVEMPDDPNRKIWFIADEAAQLGNAPIHPLFSMGRSRGVRAVLAAQDLSQLEEIHGAPAIKALVSMVGTLVVGQTMQGESAETLCRAFGSREVERPTGGAGPQGPGSAAASFVREQVSLYAPSELASRLGFAPDGGGCVLILFTGGKAYELAWPVFRMRKARPACVPAAWTKDEEPEPALEPQARFGAAPRAAFEPDEPDAADVAPGGAPAGGQADAEAQPQDLLSKLAERRAHRRFALDGGAEPGDREPDRGHGRPRAP